MIVNSWQSPRKENNEKVFDQHFIVVRIQQILHINLLLGYEVASGTNMMYNRETSNGRNATFDGSSFVNFYSKT
jgi:hypothetical protein